MERIPRIARLLFWPLLATAYIFAVIPKPPTTGAGDSFEHILAFVVLTTFVRLGWPRMHGLILFCVMAAFGAVIEITQLIPSLNRDCELKDWLVDVAATMTVLLLLAPIAASLRPYVLPRKSAPKASGG